MASNKASKDLFGDSAASGKKKSAAEKAYSAADIEVLEGLEPVKCEESLNLTLLGIFHLLVFDFEPW